MARRIAETRAVGCWCEERSEDPDSYTKNILAMGDFKTRARTTWSSPRRYWRSFASAGSIPCATSEKETIWSWKRR